VLDGSREKLGRVADELGCSVSWLTATRITAAAWPRRHRRGTVSWVVHRKLSAHPGRVILLDHFADDCRREGVTPTGPKLRAWLDANSPKASKLRSVGRPRLDPVARVEKLALQLDRDQLARLVERLAAALGEVAAA
jgi:hypothetical protein